MPSLVTSAANILKYSATEQARLLRSGELSCADLTELYLQRIRRANPQLAAFTYVASRRAWLAAKRWDRRHRQGKAPRGPLSGIPTGVKDLAFVRGMPTRFGSRANPAITAASDGLVAKRIRAAGMIIVGKLATSEFGAMPVTETDTHEPTRNPFNHEVSAGGSSGGSGCAVAGGLLPIAQGSDGAGSIRIPCALGHLVGIKPTRGLISYATPVDRELRLSSVGGLARTVEDVAAFLDALADWPHDFHGRYAGPLPAGLRVKLSTQSPLCNTELEYQQAATMVAGVLEELGCSVAPASWVDLPVDTFLMLWKRLMANAPVVMESRLQPVTAWLRGEGKEIAREDSVAIRIRLEREILDWFGDTDLWVSPTVAIKPPRIGAWKDLDPQRSFENVLGLGVYTAAFNVSGQPAITVPVGLCSEGLPIGVQIAARVGCDELLLRVAHALEQRLGGFRHEQVHAVLW